jgi:hypothetical protein
MDRPYLPWRSAREFAAAWYGADALRPGPPVGSRVPPPLADLHAIAGSGSPVVTNSELFGLDEIEVDADGRIVFCAENQGVCLWATAIDGDDPPVWMRWNEPGEDWIEEGEPLSRFLLQLVLFEAALATHEGAVVAWLDPATLRAALEPLTELSVAPWRWPAFPTRFYAGEDVIAVACPNRAPDGDDFSSLYIGARSREALNWLTPIADDGWEYFSPRDRD